MHHVNQDIHSDHVGADTGQPVLRPVFPDERQGAGRTHRKSTDHPYLAVHRTFHPVADQFQTRPDRTPCIKKAMPAGIAFSGYSSSYSQYTSTNSSNQTTSTKCQYQATPSKAK